MKAVKHQDTSRIVLENETRMIKVNRDSMELNASSDTHFYWDENSIDEVQFIKNKKSKVSGFTL